jgi:hypothetical protein
VKVSVEYEGVKSITYRLGVDDLKKAIADYVRKCTSTPDMQFQELFISRDDEQPPFAELTRKVRNPVTSNDAADGDGIAVVRHTEKADKVTQRAIAEAAKPPGILDASVLATGHIVPGHDGDTPAPGTDEFAAMIAEGRAVVPQSMHRPKCDCPDCVTRRKNHLGQGHTTLAPAVAPGHDTEQQP